MGAQMLAQDQFISPEQVRRDITVAGLDVEGYEKLVIVLRRAFLQAAAGKGKERHANGLAFEDQPMQVINRLLGSQDGQLYQAIKKIQESKRLPRERAVAELMGAINYLAGAIILLEEKPQALVPAAANDNTPKPYCTRSGDTKRQLCSECQPHGYCCGI
jgi:hypothetical protein